jgi:hypothetical protein
VIRPPRFALIAVGMRRVRYVKSNAEQVDYLKEVIRPPRFALIAAGTRRVRYVKSNAEQVDYPDKGD